MKTTINDLIAIILTSGLAYGLGYGFKQTHDFVKQETLEQISQGLSSSEKLANRLTGETLDF